MKHHEEWRSWTHPSGSSKHTISIVKTMGAQPQSTENLRLAAKLLGNRTGSDLQKFADIMENWSKQLCRRYRHELKKRSWFVDGFIAHYAFETVRRLETTAPKNARL